MRKLFSKIVGALSRISGAEFVSANCGGNTHGRTFGILLGVIEAELAGVPVDPKLSVPFDPKESSTINVAHVFEIQFGDTALSQV